MSANRDRLAAAPQTLRAGYDRYSVGQRRLQCIRSVPMGKPGYRIFRRHNDSGLGALTPLASARASLTRPHFATASRQNKNSDSNCNKVTRLISLEIFDFSALRNRNTIRNIDTKSTQTSER